MSRYTVVKKDTTVLLGKVGSFEVKSVEKGGVPCLIVEIETAKGAKKGKWLSASTIKSVLANDAACRAFLAEYDAPKPAAAVSDSEEVVKLRAELAAHKAKLAALGSTRFEPDAAQKAA